MRIFIQIKIQKRKLCPSKDGSITGKAIEHGRLRLPDGFLSHERHTIPHPAINKTRPRLTAAGISAYEFDTEAREKLSKFAYRVDFHPEDAIYK